MQNPLFFACLALFALPLIGCSKSSSQGASGAVDGGAAAPSATAAPQAVSPSLGNALAHPCGLLDPKDIEAALGTKNFHPEEHAAQEPAGDAHCTWHLPGGAGFVEILLHHPSHQERLDRVSLALKRTPITGVGDKAYIEPGLHWGHVDVLKGTQTFMLQLSRGNVATGMTASRDQMQEETLKLARKVAAQL